MLEPEIIKELEDIAGIERVSASPEKLAAHGYDVGREGRLFPDALISPSKVDQVSAVMVLANRKKLTVLPEGKGTRRHLPFFVERTLVVSTLEMNHILNLDRESLKVTLEAGVPLKTFQDALDREGLYFPPYPWCFEGAAVGGCAADGIGGPARARHGVFKQYVLGMEVVLPSGEVTRIGGQTVKNVVGYDLTSLFCGSEGSLGIVTSLTLRVVPKPPVERSLIVGFPSILSTCAAMEGVISLGRGPERISMLDRWATGKMKPFSSLKVPQGDGTTVLCHVAGLETVVAAEENAFCEKMKEHGGEVIGISRAPAEIADLWHAQGSCLSNINQASPQLMTWDMVVPRKKAVILMQRIEEAAKQNRLNLVHGGYYGNGVFHPVIRIKENAKSERDKVTAVFEDLVSFALSAGGNAAGPFGRVGIEMAKFQTPQDSPMPRLVEGLKSAIDPNGVMKPLSLAYGDFKGVPTLNH